MSHATLVDVLEPRDEMPGHSGCSSRSIPRPCLSRHCRAFDFHLHFSPFAPGPSTCGMWVGVWRGQLRVLCGLRGARASNAPGPAGLARPPGAPQPREPHGHRPKNEQSHTKQSVILPPPPLLNTTGTLAKPKTWPAGLAEPRARHGSGGAWPPRAPRRPPASRPRRRGPACRGASTVVE